MITLTDEERKKFSDWLLQDVATDNILIAQMEKLPLATGEAMVAKMRKEQDAKLTVGCLLRRIQTQTISG